MRRDVPSLESLCVSRLHGWVRLGCGVSRETLGDYPLGNWVMVGRSMRVLYGKLKWKCAASSLLKAHGSLNGVRNHGMTDGP